jgi:hypothetical protein
MIAVQPVYTISRFHRNPLAAEIVTNGASFYKLNSAIARWNIPSSST